jgi:hypothetical protein
MKHFHPKLIGTAALSALALTSAVGCKNPSSAVGNPFLAPGRVPPPATRALLPGEAQPYYPGDPLPVMQSQAPAPAGPQIAAAEPAMPSATEILKWSSPKAAPQAIALAPPAAAPATPTAAPATPTASPPQAIAATTTPPVTAAAEPSIAVPDDGDALRFAMGAPAEPQPLIPPAAAPIVVQPAPSQVVATSPQTVVPASYTEPTLAIAEPVASPWRTPQPTVPQSSSAALTLPPPPAPTSVAAAPAPWPMTAPPLFAATNSMDVRLRPVPSPPGDYYSRAPRIRMPGYETTPYVGTSDGFRPRTSMR